MDYEELVEEIMDYEELVEEIMDYEELVEEIKQQGATKLPALLIVVAEQCLERGVFVEGGMERVISKVIADHQNTVERLKKWNHNSQPKSIGNTSLSS